MKGFPCSRNICQRGREAQHRTGGTTHSERKQQGGGDLQKSLNGAMAETSNSGARSENEREATEQRQKEPLNPAKV